MVIINHIKMVMPNNLIKVISIKYITLVCKDHPAQAIPSYPGYASPNLNQ